LGQSRGHLRAVSKPDGVDGGFRRRLADSSSILIDELHLAISPVFLGQGENSFAGLDLPTLGYQRTEHVPSASATHVVFTKRVP